MIEQGFDGFTFDAWLGVAAPAGTPPPIARQLETALAAAFAEAGTRERLDALGLEPSPAGPVAMRASIERNLGLNRELLARAGVAPA